MLVSKSMVAGHCANLADSNNDNQVSISDARGIEYIVTAMKQT